MAQQQYRNHEEIVSDSISNALMGGRLNFYRGLSFFFIKIMAASSLVLIRHRFGVNFITWSTLFWCGIYTGALTLFTNNKVVGIIMTIHLCCMLVAGIWHIMEARRNQRSSKPSEARHSLDWGTSLLWMPFVRVILWLKLEERFPFRGITEYWFMKWGETLFLVTTGMILFMAGIYNYGAFLMLSGMSILRIAWAIEKEELRRKQQLIDAGQYNEILESTQEGASQPIRANRVASRVRQR